MDRGTATAETESATKSFEGMQVRVGHGHFIVPLALVCECVELPASAVNAHERNFLNIRGDLVPFISLRSIFHTAGQPDPYQKIVIVASGDRRIGLMVDQIVGNLMTEPGSLSVFQASVEIFKGATLLSDGTVALILDVDPLVRLSRAFEADEISSERAA